MLSNRFEYRVLRDDHYKQMPRHSRCGTLKNPHFSVAIGAEHRSKYEPFTGNVDVSISVKDSRWDKKLPTNKQTSGFNSIFVVL